MIPKEVSSTWIWYIYQTDYHQCLPKYRTIITVIILKVAIEWVGNLQYEFTVSCFQIFPTKPRGLSGTALIISVKVIICLMSWFSCFSSRIHIFTSSDNVSMSISKTKQNIFSLQSSYNHVYQVLDSKESLCKLDLKFCWQPHLWNVW